MSATGQALIWKFLMTFAIALFTLALFDSNSWSLVLVYAILATVGNYLIGDLMILPAAGNLIASISDGVLAALIAYLLILLQQPSEYIWYISCFGRFNRNWRVFLPWIYPKI